MKDKKTKEVQAELEEKRKLPDDLKEKRNKLAFKNFGFAIIVTLYFIFLNMGVSNIVKHILVADTKVFSGILLAITIILFEKAFKKEDGKLAIHGIEMLVLAIITLFIPYLYYLNMEHTKYVMVGLILAFNIYYLAKTALISTKIESKYLDSLSDVKNIIKKEKRKVEEVSEEELEKPTVENKKVEEKIEKPKRTRKTTVKSKEKEEALDTKPKTVARQRKKADQPKQTTSKKATKTKQEKTSDKPAKKSVAKTKQDTEEKPKTTRKRTTKKKEEEK